MLPKTERIEKVKYWTVLKNNTYGRQDQEVIQVVRKSSVTDIRGRDVRIFVVEVIVMIVLVELSWSDKTDKVLTIFLLIPD